MRKCRNAQKAHCISQAADILSLHPSNVMRKLMFIHAFIEVCKLALCIHFTFGRLLAFVMLIESVDCSYFVQVFYKESVLRLLQVLALLEINCLTIIYNIQHVPFMHLRSQNWYTHQVCGDQDIDIINWVEEGAYNSFLCT